MQEDFTESLRIANNYQSRATDTRPRGTSSARGRGRGGSRGGSYMMHVPVDIYKSISSFRGVGIFYQYFKLHGVSTYNHKDFLKRLATYSTKKYCTAYKAFIEQVNKSVTDAIADIEGDVPEVEIFSVKDSDIINGVSCFTMAFGTNDIKHNYQTLTGFKYPLYEYIKAEIPEIKKFTSLGCKFTSPSPTQENAVMTIYGYGKVKLSRKFKISDYNPKDKLKPLHFNESSNTSDSESSSDDLDE